MVDLYTALAEWRAAEAERDVTCPRCGRVLRLGNNVHWIMLRENAWFMPVCEDELRRHGCISCGWKPENTL